jgi:CRISPR-associated protein Cmr4
MSSRILYLLTRTPLHVGAGASVGAIDQPIIRERHTGFPIVPGSSLKGSFASQWPLSLKNRQGNPVRVTARSHEGRMVIDQSSDAAWLFGSDDSGVSFAGALQFTEARLLAFPIRSARGGFAWITSPLLLQRAARDGVLGTEVLQGLEEPGDSEAIYETGTPGRLGLGSNGERLVLEEYAFKSKAWPGLGALGDRFRELLPGEGMWADVGQRLVVINNGMMSFFARNSCEIAQHVRIDDETGTAAPGALFNQENVPSETLLYAVLMAFDERNPAVAAGQRRTADAALDAFASKISSQTVFQFGGDASTGLGYCSVTLAPRKETTR